MSSSGSSIDWAFVTALQVGLDDRQITYNRQHVPHSCLCHRRYRAELMALSRQLVGQEADVWGEVAQSTA